MTLAQRAMAHFRTHDLALCAYLLLDGHRYMAVEQVGPTQAEMIFADGAELQSAVADYETGCAEVEPRDFVRKVAFVRNRLRDAINHAQGP